MKRRHFITAVASSAAYVAIRLAVSVAKHPLSEEFLRAVTDGNLPKVRRMLASDSALVYARDGAGRSAYVLAYLSGHHGIAEFLAEQGFLMDVVEATLVRNWDRIDEIGEESRDLDMIRLVIRKGGDPNVRDQNGRTPQQVASELGHERAAAMLAQHERIPETIEHPVSRTARTDQRLNRPISTNTIFAFATVSSERLTSISKWPLPSRTNIPHWRPRSRIWTKAL